MGVVRESGSTWRILTFDHGRCNRTAGLSARHRTVYARAKHKKMETNWECDPHGVYQNHREPYYVYRKPIHVQYKMVELNRAITKTTYAYARPL